MLRILRQLRLVPALFFILYSVPSSATMVLPLDLRQMTEQAGRIFVGRCDDLSQDLDENGIPATYAHLTVTQGIKGAQTGETILIKQFGVIRWPLDVREGEKAIVPMKTMTLSSGPYQPGADYLLFLYPESSLGFTSPVGAGQGRFAVITTAAVGAAALMTTATNPLDNRFLGSFPEGPAALNAMVEKIREYIKP